MLPIHILPFQTLDRRGARWTEVEVLGRGGREDIIICGGGCGGSSSSDATVGLVLACSTGELLQMDDCRWDLGLSCATTSTPDGRLCAEGKARHLYQ